MPIIFCCRRAQSHTAHHTGTCPIVEVLIFADFPLDSMAQKKKKKSRIFVDGVCKSCLIVWLFFQKPHTTTVLSPLPSFKSVFSAGSHPAADRDTEISRDFLSFNTRRPWLAASISRFITCEGGRHLGRGRGGGGEFSCLHVSNVFFRTYSTSTQINT